MEEKKNIYDPADITGPQYSEIRIPVVGCCGHWLSSVGVGEKKTTYCPVCKKEGVLPFSRRVASEQEREPKTEQMSSPMESEESEVSPILKPEDHVFLPQIINHLDPCSFVRFSRACKTFHRICFNSREIKVIFEIPKLHFTRSGQLQNEGRNTVLGSAEVRQKLRNYPFEVRVKHLDIIESGFLPLEYFHNIRTLLNEFPITTISKISVEGISDWNGFLQCVKDFHIADVRIWFNRFANLVLIFFHGFNLQIPEEVATYLLQNTVLFESDVNIKGTTAGLILNSSVQRLHLKKANISQETFVELIKRFAHSTEEVQWQLGQQQFDFGHYDIFNLHNPLHNEEDGPEERPVVAVDGSDRTSFWILRKDGSRVKCFYHDQHIVFSTEKFGYEPDPDYNPYEVESEDDYY